MMLILHILINGEGGIMSIFLLGVILFHVLKEGLRFSVIRIICGLLEINSVIFLVILLWYIHNHSYVVFVMIAFIVVGTWCLKSEGLWDAKCIE